MSDLSIAPGLTEDQARQKIREDLYTKQKSELEAQHPEATALFKEDRQTQADAIYADNLQKVLDSVPPEQAQDESYKLLSSLLLGHMTNQEPTAVYESWDAAVETWSGSKIRPKDFFDRTRMAWNTGWQQVDLGGKYWDLAEAERMGADTAGLSKEIADLEAKIPNLEQSKNILPRAFFDATELAGQVVNNQIKSIQAATKFTPSMVGAGVTAALIGGQVGPQALAPEELFTVPGFSLAMMNVGLVTGSVMSMAKVEAGHAYKAIRDMRDANGAAIPANIAWKAASAVGAVNGIIEFGQELFLPGLGEVPKELLKKALGEGTMKTFAQKLMEKPILKLAAKAANSTLGKAVVKGAAGIAVNAVEETGQEDLQEIVAVLGEETAKAFTNAAKGTKFENADPEAIKERIVQTTMDSLLSFGAAGALGGAAMGGLKASTGQYSTKAAIENQADRDVSAQAEAIKQAFAETPEGGRQAVRTEDGKIRVQTSDPVTNEAGETSATVLAGDPNTGERYGYAKYTLDGQKVVINDLALEDDSYDSEAADQEGPAPVPLQDSAEVRRELIMEVAAQNPGMDIVLETKNPETQRVMDEIIAQNPRGPEAGLNWYEAGDRAPADTASLQTFKLAMKRAFPAVQEGGINLMADLTGRRAARAGLAPDAYVKRFFQDKAFTTKAPEGVQAAAQRAGASWRDIIGTTVFKDSQAIIYASQKADFRTLAHEMMHGWFNEIEETKAQDFEALSKAFGVTGAWTDKNREHLAYAFENYLENGKAESEEMKSLLQKAVEWMKSVYQTISGQIPMNKDIVAAFDAMFAQPDHPINQTTTQAAQAGEERRTAQRDGALNQEAAGSRSVQSVIFHFPEELKGYSDIHSQSQIAPLSAFGRGVVSADGKEIRIGAVGVSHAGLAQGLTDAKRFYFGYSREKQAVYVVAKNGMDESFIRKPAVLQGILSQVFDKYKLNVAQGKKLEFQERDSEKMLFQQAAPTDSKEFKEWFGESKVVDEEGKPLVVYHGTHSKNQIDGFLTRSSELGAHFGTIKQAEDVAGGEGITGGSIYPVFLSMKNPLYLQDYGSFDTEFVVPQLREVGILPADANEKNYKGEFGLEIIQKAIKKKGFDGIVYLNRREGVDPFEGKDSLSAEYVDTLTDEEFKERFPEAENSFIVFSPEQIKSVNNRGTWDKEDARILFQKSDPEEAEKAFKSATKELGTTDDIREAGYVLPNGTMLDFSGKVDGGDAGDRAMDHRQITWDGSEKYYKDGEGSGSMRQFIKFGAIRIDANSGMADMENLPTADQWSILRQIVEESGNVWMDLKDGDRRASLELEDMDFAEAKGLIRRFYNGEEIGDATLFQLSEDSLRDAAFAAEDWQDFMGQLEAFGDGEEADGLSKEEREAWYKATYERILAEKKKPSVAQANEAFRDTIEYTLDDFLRGVFDTLTFSTAVAPADAEEQALYEQKQQDQGRIRKQMHPTVVNAALRIGGGKDLTEQQRKSVLTLMRKEGAEGFYRKWYSRLMGDDSLLADEAEEAAALPDIEAVQDQGAAVSIESRLKLMRGVKDEALRKRIASGEIVPEKEVKEYLDSLETQKKALEKDLEEKKKALLDDAGLFSRHERTFIAQTRRIEELEAKEAKQTKEITQAIDKGAALSDALISARQEARLTVKALKAEHAALAKDIKDEAKLAKHMASEDALAEYKAHLKEIDQRAKEAKTIRDHKISLSDHIMRQVPKGVKYERAQEIREIQALIDPNFRRAKEKWHWEKYQAILGDVNLPKEILDRLEKKDLNEWSIGELEDLSRQVDDLIDLGKRERDHQILEWKAERMNMATGIVADAIKGGKYQAPDMSGSQERKKQVQGKDNILRSVQLATTNAARIANMIDGGKNGANTQALIAERRAVDAEKKAHMDRRMKPVLDEMKKRGIKAQDLYAREKIEGIGPRDSAATLTHSDLMYIRIGLQDENTRQAIAFGNLHSQTERDTTDEMVIKAQGEERLKNLALAVENTLTDGEKAIAELIGKDFRDEFGRMNQVFIDEFNNSMAQVENYVPIIRQDVAASNEKHEKAQSEELLNVGGVSIKRNPEKGFTIERIKIAPKHQRAVKLDLYGTWIEAMERQEHFTAYTHYVRKLNATYKGGIGMARVVQDAIVNTYGKGTLAYISEYISEIANPSTMNSQANIDKIVRSLRGNLGAAYLGWKVSGVLKQAVTSPIPYLAYVGPLDMAKSAFEYMTDAKAFEATVKESSIMRHRVMNPIFEAIKMAKKDTTAERGLAAFSDAGMKGLELVDWASVAIGWKATYNAATAKIEAVQGAEKKTVKIGGKDYKIGKDWDMDPDHIYTASEIADDVTVACQPTADPAELAPLFKQKGKGGEFAKAFTQFGTALNVIWQQFTYDIPTAIKTHQFGTAVRMVASYALAGIFLGLLTEGHDPDDDDKDKEKNFLYWSMTQATDSVPLISAFVTSFWHKIATGEPDQPYNSSLYPLVDKIYAGSINVTNEDWDKAARNFGEALGYGLGLPVSGAKELEAAKEIGPQAFIGRRK